MADPDPFSIADRLKRNRFVITAEQASPAQMKRYNTLTRQGVIDAVTLPDLPLAARLRDLRAVISGSLPSTDPLDSIAETRQPIATVSAALRSRDTVRNRVIAAIERGAKAVLALSGGGLSRRMLGPLGRLVLPMDAFSTLDLVTELRRSGEVPSHISLWAVENPLIQTVGKRVDRLSRKIDAGAEAIITQPPLLWHRFESWWNEVIRRDLIGTPIVVGVPVPKSVDNIRLWFFLTGLGTGGSEGREVIDHFRNASKLDAEDCESLCTQWVIDLIDRIKTLPNVAGIHLMPIVGSRGLESLLSQASLNQFQRARSDLQALKANLKSEGVSVVHEPGVEDDQYIRSFLQDLDAFTDARSAATPETAFSTYWNRITYKQHFRRPLARRPFTGVDGDVLNWELAVDLRQWASPASLRKSLEESLPHYADGRSESEGSVLIGDFVPYSQSIVWQFNSAFWNDVIDFVGAHGRDYRDAIKGSPDANLEFIRHNAGRFFEQVQRIRSSDSGSLCYVEIGVASVDYARAFIDTLATLAHAEGLDLGTVTYVLCDNSRAVLDHARSELGRNRRGIALKYVHGNAEAPTDALRAFAGRVLRVHLTNVFDNLPGDKLAQIGGDRFLIETRLYLPANALAKLARSYDLEVETLKADLVGIPATGVGALLGKYRDVFRRAHGKAHGDLTFYRFWQDLYGNPDDRETGLKLEERYSRIEAAGYDFVRPGTLPEDVDGDRILGEVLAEYPHNVWLHLSNRAVESGLQLLALLHPQGALEIVDIIVRKIEDYHNVPQRLTSKGKHIYRMGFKGPAKYDGSAVDWFNGRLLEATAKAVYPECAVTYEGLDAFGKPQMTLMEIRRS